nr:carboxypeptidase-like regulatory domain-containing protein [Allomuricauda sp.]
MSVLTKHLSVCFILLWAFPLWAQRDFIQGQLLDSSTEEPIVFATIRIKGKALGVISNQDGGFRFPLEFREEGDSLIISSMGYETKSISILSLMQDELNTIKLTPGVIELDEVLVEGERARRRRLLSAKGIVRKAIKAIPENYPTSPFSTVGYYRDYQLGEGEYINLNEAILEVFDLGFGELDNLNTKVQIYDKIQNFDFRRDTIADNKYGSSKMSKKIINNAYLFDYGGNEFTILRVHDAIRNYKIDTYDFVNRLETDFFKNHFFRKQKDTYSENEVLYTVRITKTLPGYFVSGLLYISKRDFAIHKMKYTVYEEMKYYVYEGGSLNFKKNIDKREKKQLFFEIITEYKRGEDNKMYLNYISFHNDFWLIEPPEFDIDAIVLVPNCQCFEVRFTDEVDPISAGDKNNYNWSFKGKKIKFKEIVVFDKAVRLFPDLTAETFKNMAYTLSGQRKNPKKPNRFFKTEVLNLRDKELKYLLRQDKYRRFQQFREYFVQKINLGARAPKGVQDYMDKNRPIFEDQPVSKPADFENYWMNTPLQRDKN